MLFDYYKLTNKILPMIALSFIVGLCILAGMILLIIPGIIMMFSLFYYEEVYIDSDMKLSIREVLYNCREMMKGHKMEMFIFILSFIGWNILASFTFSILYLASTIYNSYTI